MSLRAQVWAWEAPRQVTREELLVLLVLADAHNSETGACFPSTLFIARKARMSRATVHRCLSRLEALGLITRKIGGGRRANDYTLFGVALEKLPPELHVDPDLDYPHPPQNETPQPTLDGFDPSHSETAARAPDETAAASPVRHQSEYNRNRKDRAPRLVDNSRSVLPPPPAQRTPEDLNRCRDIIADIRAGLGSGPPPCTACGQVEYDDHVCPMEAANHALEDTMNRVSQ